MWTGTSCRFFRLEMVLWRALAGASVNCLGRSSLFHGEGCERLVERPVDGS